MRGSIFPTGLIVMPVFACADKGDYAVSVGCTITVKFNAIDGEVIDEDFSSTDDPCTGFAYFWMSFVL